MYCVYAKLRTNYLILDRFLKKLQEIRISITIDNELLIWSMVINKWALLLWTTLIQILSNHLPIQLPKHQIQHC